MAFRLLGNILVEMGFIDADQLENLLDEKDEQPDVLIGQVALNMNLIKEDQLVQALAEQLGMPIIELGDVALPKDVISTITEPMAQMYRIIPISFKDNVLTIAMAEPQKVSVIDELQAFLGYEVRGVVAAESDVEAAINRYYNSAEDIGAMIDELVSDQEDLEGSLGGKHEITDGDSVPVRKLLNMILLLAIKDAASDIHFEPFEDAFKVRVKADGVLYEMTPPPRHMAEALTARIKVMANLDIAERRLPQDGRIELTVGGHPVDLRVSVLPTMFGESTVIRVLDRSVVNLDLNAVGMNPTILEDFRNVIKKPNGIMLVTGPTGSGKTTTLYSALNELNDPEEKLITTEDPVEYDIDGIVQVPIDASIGVTFASCLRAILRQDPDRILVGEIRDYETAEIAIQAALTGHMVFSTLHTNDAPSTITRMRDMGVPVFMITATVEAILAQRLVRRICSDCIMEVPPRSDQLFDLGLEEEDIVGKKFYVGEGCEACNGSGYRGRIGIFELMVLNDALRDMVMDNVSTDELRNAARGYGMTPLRDSGRQLIYDGITTAEEIIRETIMDA